MRELIELVGREADPEHLSRDLFDWVRSQRYAVVGALQATCADEVEREGAEAFQRAFVDYLLPRLKPGRTAPFRLANLGSRYEPGSVAIVEDHFALEVASDRPKLILVKLSSHVGVEEEGDRLRFGRVQRYGRPSSACGALDALLSGRRNQPFLDELRSTFARRGSDLLALLADEDRVEKHHRHLLAAAANALVQSERALNEIRSHRPRTPTDYLVLPAVTLNRLRRDGELVCGYHWVKQAGDMESALLPSDPRRISVGQSHGRVVLRELAAEPEG